MDVVSCPRCRAKATLHAGRVYCQQCKGAAAGSRPSWRTEVIRGDRRKAEFSAMWGALASGLVVVPIFLLLAYWVTREPTPAKPSRPAQPAEQANLARANAYGVAEQAITPLLISPASASYQVDSQKLVHEGDRYWAWKLAGHVDAKNAFGVPIRHRWETLQVYDTLLDSWETQQLDFGGQAIVRSNRMDLAGD